MSLDVLGDVSNAETLKLFWCPGCECAHFLETSKWTWDGDRVKPTASPSLLVNGRAESKGTRCHFFIRDGVLQFLADCEHGLKGQHVPMVPWAESRGLGEAE